MRAPRARVRGALLLAAVACLLGVLAAPALAAEPPALPDVEDEVMCPTCNVPLNVAESPQADEQRAFIRELIAQGRTKEEIKEALVAEYGEDVLALPRREGFAGAAYLVPVLAAGAVVAGLALLLPRWRRRGAVPVTADAPAGPTLDPADAARLDEELRRYGR